MYKSNMTEITTETLYILYVSVEEERTGPSLCID
jgi:hypothetical protein